MIIKHEITYTFLQCVTSTTTLIVNNAKIVNTNLYSYYYIMLSKRYFGHDNLRYIHNLHKLFNMLD